MARYVIENGIDPSRISVRGYAQPKAASAEIQVDNRSSNRRVEIRLYRGADQNPHSVRRLREQLTDYGCFWTIIYGSAQRCNKCADWPGRYSPSLGGVPKGKADRFIF